MTCKELMSYSLGESIFTGDFYMIALKKIKSGYVLYGKTKYDHNNGSMVFMKPRQIIEVSNVQFAEKGFVMFVHEDYLSGHTLHSLIKKYGYFEYEINEALHISPAQEKIMWELYDKIRSEYDQHQDEFIQKSTRCYSCAVQRAVCELNGKFKKIIQCYHTLSIHKKILPIHTEDLAKCIGDWEC